MLSIFLNAKNWQLFAVLLVAWGSGIYLEWTVAWGGEMEGWWKDLQPVFYEISFLAVMAVLLGWILAVGLESNKRCKPELRRSPRIMVRCLVYTACYLMFSAVLRLAVSGNADFEYQDAILPFHFAAMACVFYSMIYTARRFVTLQEHQEVGFTKYSGPFFLIWFFPLGVWFLQPQVNESLGSSSA